MTALPFIAFGLFGFMYGNWQVLLAELQRSMGLSDGALGAAITIGFVGSLPSMFFGGKLVDRFGAERVISSTAGIMALALTGVAIASNWWTLTILLFFFFGGSGAYDVGINAAAINLEQLSGQRLLSYIHGTFSGAAAFGALSAGLLLLHGTKFRSIYIGLALMLLVAAAIFLKTPILRPHRTNPASDVASRELLLDVRLISLAVIVAMAYFGEGSLENWSTIYLRDFVNLPVALGASGVVLFHLAMQTGRMTSGATVGLLGRRFILIGAGLVTACGILLATTIKAVPTVLVGFFAAGVTLSVVAPLAFSIAGDLYPTRSGSASAIITFIGYSAFLLGPGLIGGLAQAFGLDKALAMIMLGGLLISVLSLRNEIAN
jgi:MFS family permease